MGDVDADNDIRMLEIATGKEAALVGESLYNDPVLQSSRGHSGIILGKSVDLVKILKKRRINIACVLSKWGGSKARDLDRYKLWYSGNVRHRNGLGILVDEELRRQVVEVIRVGLEEEVKLRFWEELDKVVRNVPSSEKIVIAGDFNGHFRVLPGGYDDVHGGFGYGDRNGEGASLLDFVRDIGLVILNLSFLKKEDHLITFYRAIAKTQINVLLLRKGDKGLCKDCKVILSEHL
ncbi:uncharacterized protein LOC107844401 [Capsicum annuum]|uniref:uncharacterized protein LOC107844401 n=1 Tax=Capsicum annuum TaxID=4072 RepID=UPI001FB06E03|nr:uncharacterized protein LOC107844401 [Capsicum annuum]